MTTEPNTVLRMKRNDTLPALRCTLTDDGDPVDLTSAERVRVILRRLTPSETVVDRDVTAGADGVVTMEWQAEDTEAEGTLHGEIEVTWPDGTIQTWPPAGVFRVEIKADLA